MTTLSRFFLSFGSNTLLLLIAFASISLAQEERRGPPGGERPEGGQRPEGGPRGFEGRPEGGPRGPGGPGFGGPGFGRINPIMMALDTDKDGVLSKEEISKAAVALLALDKNKDGSLTEDELRPEGGPPQEGFGRRGGPGGEGGGPGGQGGNPEDMAARFMQFDANKDGSLSKDELSERMQGLIGRADTNSDGLASKEELIAMAKKEMSSGSGMGGRGGPGGERGGPGGPGGERGGPGGERGGPGGAAPGPEERSERRPQRPQ